MRCSTPDSSPRSISSFAAGVSRAWCWRSLAAALPAGDPRKPTLDAAAKTHLEAALPHVSGDYMGEHWLATFAMLAMTE